MNNKSQEIIEEIIDDKQEEDDYCLWDHEDEDEGSNSDESNDSGIDWEEE